MAGSSSRGKNVLFGLPERGKDAASRPRRGRVCEQPECSTILSTFNSATMCWTHAQPSFRRTTTL
jgi:hypothetical protein